MNEPSTNYSVPILLNNQGASLIASGKIIEGREIIMKALNVAKQITASKQRTRAEQKLDVMDELKFVWLDHANVDAPLSNFIYRRPVQIVLCNPRALERRSLAGDITTVVVFNLSLCFHLEALKCTRLIPKALSGYQIVLNLRKHRRRRSRCIPMDLALFNNMAHIHAELLSDYPKAKIYVRSIARILQKLSQHNIVLDASDRQGFRMTAMWRQPTCAPMA